MALYILSVYTEGGIAFQREITGQMGGDQGPSLTRPVVFTVK
jgi:hypothetical protein